MEYANVSMLNGSYKLSDNIIKRLTSTSIIGENKQVMPSASKFEIATMLYFSHICDASGMIRDFRTSSLEQIIGCSDRQCANIIENLRKKLFITVKGEKWTGLKTIRIVNNDFSHIKKYTKDTKYLNTSSNFFDRIGEWYDEFMKLSLNAMRTFILIMHNYSFQNGYRIEIKHLLQKLGIKNKYLLLDYLDEMKSLLGEDFYFIYAGRDPRVKYEIIMIRKENRKLLTYNAMDKDKDTSFQYDVYRILRECRIKHDATMAFRNFWYRIYTYVYHILENNQIYLTYHKLLDMIKYAVATTENLQMAVYQIGIDLETLCAT